MNTRRQPRTWAQARQQGLSEHCCHMSPAEFDAYMANQERYMSSPEYAELRGIAGAPVAAKASIVEKREDKELLFWLQARSLEPGGLKKFCADFLTQFPDRVGVPLMRELKPDSRGVFSEADAIRILKEIPYQFARTFEEKVETWKKEKSRASCLDYPDFNESEWVSKNPKPVHVPMPECERTFASLAAKLLKARIPGGGDTAQRLEQLLVDLCINPKVNVATFGAPEWFDDLGGALREYKQIWQKRILDSFAMTGISAKIFETLDLLRDPEGCKAMVLLTGESRIGKTTSAQTWCRLHSDKARFVSISGITHKTGVFRAIARAIGVASNTNITATDMQERIQDVLVKSGLILVLDEAHHLFSPCNRPGGQPELIDWIDTSLWNESVRVGLLATSQFHERMRRTEKHTPWNSQQLKGRVTRNVLLPDNPSIEDLWLVARKMLPGVPEETIHDLADHAISLATKMPFQALSNVVDEAKRIARAAGRDIVTFQDCDRARECCEQSAAAWSAVPPSERKRPGRPPASAPENDPANAPPISGRATNLTGLAPAETSPGNSPAATPLQRRRGQPAGGMIAA